MLASHKKVGKRVGKGLSKLFRKIKGNKLFTDKSISNTREG